MMKDEAPFLLEWYAHHLAVGFTKILVYTNDCTDGTDDMLIRLEELGWCQHFRNDVPEGKKPQPNALALATQNEEVTDSDWILTMDADEFLSIKVGRGWVRDIMERIDPEAVTVRTATGCRTLPNDAVLVCAGGILPDGLLREMGIMIETKYGTA